MAYPSWNLPLSERPVVTSERGAKVKRRIYVVPWESVDEQPDHGDVFPGDTSTLPERVLYSRLLGPDKNAGKARVEVVTSKTTGTAYGSMLLTGYEWGNGVTEQGTRFEGTAQFACNHSEVVAQEAALRWTPFPAGGASAAYTPIVTRTRAVQGVPVEGEDRIYAYYGYIRVPGVATVELSASLEGKPATQDLDGLHLVGPIETAGIDGQWFIKEGSPIEYIPRDNIVFKGAFERYEDLRIIDGLLGKVNDSYLPNFFWSEKGTLWFTRRVVTHVWAGSDLWYATLVFDKEPRGWNNLITRSAKTNVIVPEYKYKFNAAGVLVMDDKEPKVPKIIEKEGFWDRRVDPPVFHEMADVGNRKLFPEAGEDLYNEGDTRMLEEGDFHLLDSMILTSF